MKAAIDDAVDAPRFVMAAQVQRIEADRVEDGRHRLPD
jgi:hypothetical protein